jgi:hypothetical protein
MSDDLTNISDTVGKELIRFLTSNNIVVTMKFPSVNHPRRGSWNYRPTDYRAVAGCIGSNKVRVYSAKINQRAQYWNVEGGDFFVLSPSVANNIHANRDILLHEATHMAQDYKRMQLTDLEAEMDAHFAQALFLVRAKLQHLAKAVVLPPFITAAEEFNDDRDYMLSKEFRDQRDIMRTAVRSNTRKDLNTKRKLDGITV